MEEAINIETDTTIDDPDDRALASAPARTGGMRARAFRISDRLNKVSKIYLGPAQFGGFRPGGTEVKPLTDKPCPACGQPMALHNLVHSDSGRQRFYCPDPPPKDDHL